MEMGKEKLWKNFQRIRTLVRAINVIRGLRRKDERPPENHWAVRDEEMEQKLLDDYYAFKGWDQDGVPKREILRGLDLDYVSQYFEENGMYEEND